MKKSSIAAFVIAAGLAGTISLNYYRSLSLVPPQDAVTADVAPTEAIVKEFTVNGANFSFSPSTLTVKKGDKVRIIFENIEGFHDFRIDKLNVATRQIRMGDRDVVEFVAADAGSFEYYCSVGSHRAMGMKGTLVVEK
ncbi:MAG: cupredoxin domain-containing protein [bacterium]|nr:cupredoxin domain-containing protein [bacterium]